MTLRRRIYTTLGDKACSVRITVPVTPGTAAKLEAMANAADMTRTELARTLIVAGVGG